MKGHGGGFQHQGLTRVPSWNFTMIPRSDVPRSTFITSHSVKTTFDAGYLVPILCEEVLPGDVYKGDMTVFARLGTTIFPVMDHLCAETFFFFVPNRLTYVNWVKMMGEQTNPGDSISFSTPQIVSPAGGFPAVTSGGVGSATGIYDYFGLPVFGQIGGANTISINALPLRAYNLIYNTWFRDENLINSVAIHNDAGPDPSTDYVLMRRCKYHDYFTSALPWPEKGGVDTTLPLGGQAPVTGIAIASGGAVPATVNNLIDSEFNTVSYKGWQTTSAGAYINVTGTGTIGSSGKPAIFADLSQATAGPTLQALRLAITTQQFLERDARGGTRYVEILRNHFGIQPEDIRLQRPEYIGGGRSDINTTAVPQTTATGLTGGSTPQGSLAGTAQFTAQHSFSYHGTEHGFIIGLAHVGADLTYQQGIRKLWSRLTRFDHYWPTFAYLGEQPVLNKEIYADGSANDTLTFGYAERWAEYRYRPSQITGLFRSTTAGTIHQWHLAQQFTTLPTLAQTFISDTPPLSRALAAGPNAAGMQIIWDSVFTIRNTRPVPMYSVPGLMRF